MGLETGTYISDLVATNPVANDPASQGDDHMRLIKSTVKVTFPNVSGAVTPTHTELNYVDGVTSAIQTQLDAKLASASYTAADVLAKMLTVDGAGSGLDSDLLDGQHGSYYTNATNISSGTLSDARLPTTQAGKTFTSAFGYGAGAGGTVTQATSKSTGVTLNTPSGRITMNNATLNAGDLVVFEVSNSTFSASDSPVYSFESGASGGAYSIFTAYKGVGLFAVAVRNVTGSNLSEAIVIDFAVIKGATA